MIRVPEQCAAFLLPLAIALTTAGAPSLCAAADLPPVLPWAVVDAAPTVDLGYTPQTVPFLEAEPDSISAPPAHAEKTTLQQLIRDKVSLIKNTVDQTHDRLEYSILQQAVRLDDFFGSVSAEEKTTGYQLRLRNTVRFEEGGKVNFGTTVRLNLVLSKISEQLRLIVSGEHEPGPFAPSLPEDPGTPGMDRIFQNAKIINTELRYGLIKTPHSELFLGAGVRLQLPFEAFTRGRYQYTHSFSAVALMRFAETVFYNNNLGVGQTTEFSLERSLNKRNLLRWSNTGTVSEKIPGLELGTELSLISQLNAKSAITFTGGVYGNTDVDDTITNFRVSARYRRNFLRTWLFYELEPEMSWPRRGDDSYPSQFAFMIRLEVLFQGNSAEIAAKNGGTAGGHPANPPR